MGDWGWDWKLGFVGDVVLDANELVMRNYSIASGAEGGRGLGDEWGVGLVRGRG